MTRSLLSPLALLPLVALLAGCPETVTTCDQRGAGVEEIDWFLDRDRDGFGDRTVSIRACSDEDPSETQPDQYVTDATDCDDLRPESFPQGVELCDGLDNNCNGAVDDGLPFNDFWIDDDGDGYGNPSLQIEACSVPENGADQPGDCDDTDPLINRDAIEICDGIDNDCDTLTDDLDSDPFDEGGVDLLTGSEWRPDVDNDSFGDWDDETVRWACEQPEGFVADATDCNDTNATINPNNQEVCNGIDDDCDQLFDDSDDTLDTSTQTRWYRDADADGHGVSSQSLLTCTTPWFYALTDDDCDDTDPLVLAETNTFWAQDLDGDGFGAGDVTGPTCTSPGADHVTLTAGVDCDDTEPLAFPGQLEVCDTVDNDCDGLIDDEDAFIIDGVEQVGSVDPDSMSQWWNDTDQDGYGGQSQTEYFSCEPNVNQVGNGDDCDDLRSEFNPAAVEVCDGFDNDCDFLIDDDDENLDVDSGVLFTRDADGDGFGDLDDVFRACERPEGYVAEFGDCDDSDVAIGLPTNWWMDVDGDGQGAGEVSAPDSCDPPGPDFVPWYLDLEPDCDPDDATRLSGEEICYDGLDQGCNDRDFVVNGSCAVDLPDTCFQAQTFDPLTPNGQQLEGTLVGSGNELDTETLVPGTCFTNVTAVGSPAEEEIVPVRIPAGERMRARLSVEAGDSVLYLVSDCFAASSCIVGKNSGSSPGSTESLVYTNTTADDQVLYLVLDGRRVTDSRAYTLNLDLF